MVSTLFCLVAVSIITIFENRYFLIFAEHTWWRRARYPFLATNYILALLYYLPTVLAVPEQTSARQIIFKDFPEFKLLDTPSNPVYVLVLDNPWVSVRQIAMEGTVVVETLVFVMLLKIKMKNVVKEMKMSENTAKLQKAFLKALYIQVSLPLLVILIPSAISVFSGILGISTQSVNNLVYITFSCHGLTSTIVMILIQNPYREFCFGIVRKRKMRATTVTSSFKIFCRLKVDLYGKIPIPMPTWSDLPLEFKIRLVEILDLKSRCRFRRCSTSDKLIVDCCPLFLKYVKLEEIPEEQNYKNRIPKLLPLKCIQDSADLNFTFSIKKIDVFYPDTCSLRTNQFSEFLSLFHSRFSIINRLVFKGFENPRSRSRLLNNFKMSILEKRESNYDLFDLKIRATSLFWGPGKGILEFLEFFDANVLKRLCVGNPIPKKCFVKLVNSEHWRKLKRVMFVEEMDVGIESFLNLERFDVKLKTLNVTDVWRVVQKFLFKNSPRLSGFTIFYRNKLPAKEIFKHTLIPMDNTPIEGSW
ncbi:hypothetical protein B9Z55_020845 [Caenorhabditis nigoni]|nr:hypothetical protein B9Z55_020845 [Caenorhabditis nigoni]